MLVDPYRTLSAWLEEAEATEPRVHDAAQLATANRLGRPSIRTVLVKAVDPGRGLVFHTNHRSRKGRDLLENPHAALCFHWKSLARQVIVEGAAAPISTDEADTYFATRPRGSQLAAWASEQSAPLLSREALEARLAAITQRYDGAPVPRPPHWGGFRLTPRRFEFWMDGVDRLHERFAAVRRGDGWAFVRLNP